jgi:hypothetical protein
MSSPTILAIDPGNEQSAWMVFTPEGPREFRIEPNEDALRTVGMIGFPVAIEMVASYGMAVGKEVFETCVWIGRFVQAAKGPAHLVYRKDVKMALCGSMRAKDANIRQALLDRYPATGGGKVPQVGTKAKPGPLYGIKSHLWSALAVAETWKDMSMGIYTPNGKD